MFPLNRRQFYRRVGILCGAMAVVLLVLGSTLYNIQKVNGDYYYE